MTPAAGGSRLRGLRLARPLVLVLVPLAALAFASTREAALAASSKVRAPRSSTEADSLAGTVSGPARDRALIEWARHAGVNDLAWLLRRSPAELGGAEPGLVDAALAATPPARDELRQRWLARRLLAAPRSGRKGEPGLPDLSRLRPHASVFRIAVLLPDSGETRGYAVQVRAALDEGLSYGRAAGAPPIVLDSIGTAAGDPARVAAGLAQARLRSDVVVGELLSVQTLALATGSVLAGVVLVSPTATDERIGRVGPRVFQVGPGAETRARALAEIVLGPDAHAAAIVGSAAGIRGAFAAAFAAEVEARGGRIARREVVRAGADVAQQASGLLASGADVLFWDGGARELEPLVRALAAAGASLTLCGGPALAPDGMPAKLKPLLEGVTWVADDWRLSDDVRARLDTLAAAAGFRAGSLWTRGFLAGRRIADAVDAGARCAAEVADQLRHPDPVLAAAGSLACERDGARLPVFVTRHGKAVEAGAAQ